MIEKKLQNLFFVMYCLSAPLFIFRLGSSSFYCFDLVVLLIGAYCLCAGAIKPEFRVELDPRIIVLTLLFLAADSVSLFVGFLSFGSFINMGEHFDGALRYSFMFLATPFIAHYLLRSERTIEPLLKLMALSYLVAPILNLFAYFFKWELFLSHSGRAQAFYLNPNVFGAALLISMPIYLWLFLKEKFMWKMVGLAGFTLSVVGIILSGSRTSALIGFLIFTLQIGVHIFGGRGFLNKMSRFLRPGLVILALSLILGLALQGTPFFEDKGLKRIVEFGEFLGAGSPSESEESYLEKSASAQHRLDLIVVGLDFIVDRLGGWVGHGLNQTRSALQAQGVTWMAEIHVNLLNLWVETGLMGLGAYVLFLLYLYKNLRALKHRSPQTYHVMGFVFLSFFLIGLNTTHTYLGFYYAPLLPLMHNFKE